MPKTFFERLRDYYQAVASVLRGEADAASVFPNTTDVGIKREAAYAEFLRGHVPSKCNVVFGGYVFANDGTESGQLDVIVSTDTAPRFELSMKTFAPVEGTLAVAAIKSTLNKNELEDALTGFARIPLMESLEGRVNPQARINNYDDWPYKILYASDGVAGLTLLAHLNEFYRAIPDVPMGRRPNLIHVLGKYFIVRLTQDMRIAAIPVGADPQAPLVGEFHLIAVQPDVGAIAWTLDGIQTRANASTHIIYRYDNVLNGVMGTLS